MEAKLISSLLLNVDPVSSRLTALQKRVKSLGEASEALPAAHKQLMGVQTQLTKIHFLLTRPEHPLSPALCEAVRLNSVHVDAHLRRTQSALARIEAQVLKNQNSVIRFLRNDTVCKQLNQVLQATATMRASCQGLITEILLGKLRESSGDEKSVGRPGSPHATNELEKIANGLHVGHTDTSGHTDHEEEATTSGAEPRAMRLSDVPPSDLPTALRGVLLGSHTPAQCLPLIQQHATTRSLASWYAAHELLMLATADDAALCSPHYQGTDSHWLQQLYQCATLLRLPDEPERARVARCLREAEAAGVVEVAAAVIGDIFVAHALAPQLERVVRADTELWTRVLFAERGLAELTESLSAYRRAQRFSQLVGIALQLIPLAGGALAGLLSAGADITVGVGVSDAVEAVLGYATQLGTGAAESVRDRLLARARAVVADDSLGAMEESQRHRVVHAIEQGGMSVAVLRDLLDSRDGGGAAALDEEESKKWLNDRAAADPATQTVRMTADAATEHDNASSLSNVPDDSEFSVEDEGESCYVVGLWSDEPARKAASWWKTGRSCGMQTYEGSSRRTPSAFRELNVNRTTADDMAQDDLAMWWAAYSLDFDDGKLATFHELWPALLEFLVDEELSGNELAIFDEDAQAVSSGAIRAATGRAKRLPFGRKRKLVRFLAQLGSM